MLKHSFFEIVCITIFFVIVLFVNKFYVPYNNKLEKEMLITREYTNSQIIEMIDRINMHIYKSKRFENEYKIECLRKIQQGYYAVFKKTDGQYVYVFLYKNLMPIENAVIIVDRFKSKKEFSDFISEKRTKQEMIEFDSTTIFPFSGRNTSAHYTVEGVFLVDYCRNNDDKEIVECADFYDDRFILQNEREWNIPYILSVDRKN